MGLIDTIKNIIRGIIKHPIQAAMVAFLIYNIIKKNSETKMESFNEDMKIVKHKRGKTLIKDDATNNWGVADETGLISVFDNEDKAMGAFLGEKMNNENKSNCSERINKIHSECYKKKDTRLESLHSEAHTYTLTNSKTGEEKKEVNAEKAAEVILKDKDWKVTSTEKIKSMHESIHKEAMRKIEYKGYTIEIFEPRTGTGNFSLQIKDKNGRIVDGPYRISEANQELVLKDAKENIDHFIKTNKESFTRLEKLHKESIHKEGTYEVEFEKDGKRKSKIFYGIPSKTDATIAAEDEFGTDIDIISVREESREESLHKEAKKIAPCKECGKDTFNTTSDATGFCSKECEAKNKKKECAIKVESEPPMKPKIDQLYASCSESFSEAFDRSYKMLELYEEVGVNKFDEEANKYFSPQEVSKFKDSYKNLIKLHQAKHKLKEKQKLKEGNIKDELEDEKKKEKDKPLAERIGKLYEGVKNNNIQ
jgi:hypothetical protein